MLKRKASESLKKWKNQPNHKALLVKGARQIGKTFSIRQFAQENYKNVVEINFVTQPALKRAFEGELSVNEMIAAISLAMPGVKFLPHETLLFLDEIQECPQARTSIKFWVQDGRFDIVESGSMLGINYKEVTSYPVGYETEFEMYSLDFEEFLWAVGIDQYAIGQLKRYFENEQRVDALSHESMMKHLRTYMVVGGMPTVVNRFVETHNFSEVHEEQQSIVQTYLNDIAKYAPSADKPKARRCYLSLPVQLSKENTKFQYSVVEKGGTSRKFASSLDWLSDAGLVKFCHNVSTPEFPLKAYIKEDQFRVYATDIGLLISMYDYDTKAALINDTLKGPAKGGLYENLIADILLKKKIPLCYFCNDNHSVEIEFLLSQNESVIPVEVKSKKGPTASLNAILRENDMLLGIKLSAQNVGRCENKLTVPLYMAMFL
ncbi:MAG: ATP-binding protein [Fibrobacter sp.]|nr:ATP-binding protein [Fibrobacter sp.]